MREKCIHTVADLLYLLFFNRIEVGSSEESESIERLSDYTQYPRAPHEYIGNYDSIQGISQYLISFCKIVKDEIYDNHWSTSIEVVHFWFR